MADWWRLHNTVIDSIKMYELPPELGWWWVKFGCVANRFGQDGVLPEIRQLAFHLRVSETLVETVRNDLLKRELIDCIDGLFVMHDWSHWQYINGDSPKRASSSTSTDRVKRFREKQRNALETPSETVDVTPSETHETQIETPETLHVTPNETPRNAFHPAQAQAGAHAQNRTEQNRVSVSGVSGDFSIFRTACAERGIFQVGETDWKKAQREWDALPVEEKLQAIADVKIRDPEAVEIRNPALPRNYLSGKKWSRQHVGSKLLDEPSRIPSMAEQDEMVRQMSVKLLAKRVPNA